jgi:cytochrome b pre-mRNA-processing protein 3
MAARNYSVRCPRSLWCYSSIRGSWVCGPSWVSASGNLPTKDLYRRHASTFQPNIAAKKRNSITSPTSASGATTSSKSQFPSKHSSQTTDAGLASRVAQSVRQAAPTLTETYVAYGACEVLVKECTRVAEYNVPQAVERDSSSNPVPVPKTASGEDLGVGTGWWYEALRLQPTFSAWAHVTLLHLWLLTVRLRAFPREHAPAWHQHLIDHFFFSAEDRMVKLHGIASKGMRQRYLKDLFVQWRGVTAAYDEGLVKGDAVLAAAVWRNVCKADPSIDVRRLAEVVCFLRSVLREFDAMDDEVIASGDVAFGDPGGEAQTVGLPSRMMQELGEE